MCLTNIINKVIITKSPIFCYKRLHDSCSWHYSYKYKKNKVNPLIMLDVEDFNRISYGYHSRVNKKDTLLEEKNNSLFVIPPYIKYYVGLENEGPILNYVSETIIYLGRIDGFFGPLKEWFYKTKYLIKCRLYNEK